MCLVSDKIKFCTCASKSTEALKHYWKFHRYDAEKGISIMGSLEMPFSLDPETEMHNQAALLNAVNDITAWDVDFYVKNKG